MKKNDELLHLFLNSCSKKLIIMRNTLIILFISAFQVLATGTYSQTAKVNLDMKNATIKEILDEIEDQSEFYFLYNSKLIDVEKHINIDVKQKAIDEVLPKIFDTKKVEFLKKDRHIIISPIGNSSQQTISVSGIVTDDDGLPLPGVTVHIKGSTKGTVTTIEGSYQLADVSVNSILVFSFVGMITQEIEIANQTTINITLIADAIGIEEVVAIGYGTMKKSDLTGSVTTVKSEEISAYPSSGAIQSLQGRASGVQVQSLNGEPGSGFKVRVRGATSVNSSSDPLYVVDGFPGGSAPPSEDIASIEILKDASATAIYGSRGANGVILITTKRGKIGKPQVEFNSSYSHQKEIGRYDLLKTPDFIDFINETDPGKLDPNGSHANTDWQDLILQNGALKNYQLSFTGGGDNFKYYLSGVYRGQDGVVIESGHKSYSITSNLDLTISKNIQVGANLYTGRSSNQGSLSQEGTGGSGNTGVLSGAWKMQPTSGIYNEDGTYTISNFGDPHDNPYATANERINEGVGETIQASFFTDIQLMEGLKFRATFGAKTYSGRTGTYLPTTLNSGKQVGGSATVNGSRSTDLINENYLTYQKNFNEVHDITAMGGYSFQSYRGESFGAKSQNFITDAFSYWDLDGGSVALPANSGVTETELASFYTRVNYKLMDKYMVTFNARYDGSSRFAKNNKWAFFPSGALAWNVAQENFMQAIPKISQLKLRASFGITGNQAIGPYQSLAKLRTIPVTYVYDEAVNAIAPNTVANNNLTWESTAQTDIGFDLGLFGQRIQIVADYYSMKTTDLLFSLPLPEYSGYASTLKNIGSMENKGFEFTVTTVNIEGDLKWTTDFNFSKNKNKILELPEGNDIFISSGPGHMVGIGNTQILREGMSMGQFYGFVYDGVYQEGDTFLEGGSFEKEAGGEKYKDLNGDGQLTNADDRQIIGDPNPDFTWGINNSLEYKGFDLNLFIHGSQGGEIYSFTMMELELNTGYNNTTTRMLNRWTPTNTDTDIPKAVIGRSKRSSDRWVYDGSFIRLKNVSLGYKLPKTILNKMGLDFARIYVSGQNLVTISNYPGIDPEVGWRVYDGSTGNTNIGLDYGSYPNIKSYTIGIQVKF